MESSFTYCSQLVTAVCFFLTLVMWNTDVMISCVLTNWAGKKRKNSQKLNTVVMSGISLEKNEPLWVWFLGHEEKWGIKGKLGDPSLLTCSTYTKIGTIQRRLAWPLRKDDTQIREAFHIFSTFNFPVHSPQNSFLLKREKIRGEDTSEHRKAGKCWVLRRILQREASAIESELICGGSKSPCGLMDKALDF